METSIGFAIKILPSTVCRFIFRSPPHPLVYGTVKDVAHVLHDFLFDAIGRHDDAMMSS